PQAPEPDRREPTLAHLVWSHDGEDEQKEAEDLGARNRREPIPLSGAEPATEREPDRGHDQRAAHGIERVDAHDEVTHDEAEQAKPRVRRGDGAAHASATRAQFEEQEGERGPSHRQLSPPSLARQRSPPG